MASRRAEHQSEVRFRVLRLIQENPDITTREIAFHVGISNGTAYYCVTALIDKGFVKLKNFTQSKSKGNYLYELTPRGMREKAGLAVQFLERKRDEFDKLKFEIERLENELGINDERITTVTEDRNKI